MEEARMASPAPATYARVATTVRHFCSVIVDHSILSSVHHCLEPCCSSHMPLGIKCRSRHRLITSQKLRKIDPFICGHAQPLAPFGSCSPEAGHSIAPPLPRKQHMSGHLAKVITGDAISLASGKIKEVVPEWVGAPLGTTAVSGSPVQFRKGRKVRPDTSSKCDTQLLEPGDVQSPLRPKSNELNDSSSNDHPEEVELITDTSPTCKRSWDKELEHTLSELFSPSAVETLVKRAYRREGIEACLRILLKCSEDLKCCTEIIHRCMQRKALAAGSETQGDKSDYFADIQCRDLVSHLAGCLRQLPTDFGDDGSHSNKPEALANLLESMYESASVSNPPPAYDAEHPPRYEDVVSRIASPSESSTSPMSPMQITGDKLTVSEEIMSSSNDILHLKIEEDSSFLREGTSGCKQEEVTDHITFWENGVEVLPPSAAKTSVIEAQGKMLEKVFEELSLEESADRFRSETQNGVCFAADATPENSATITHQSLSRHKKLDDSYVDLEHLIQDLEDFSTELRNEAVNKFDASTTVTSTITNSTALARCARQPLSISQDVPRDVEDDESLWQRILQSLESFQTDIVDHGCQTNGLQTQDHTAICQRSSSVGIGANVTDNTSAESVAPGTQLMVICQSPKVIKVPSAAKKEKPAVPAATTASIPRFYFPRGRPTSNGPSTDQAIDHIEKVFAEFPDERASIQNMGKVAKACGCPLYWKSAMFHAASGERTGFVSVYTFIAMWRKVLKTYNDDTSRFVALLARPGCNFLLQEDFIPLLQDIVESHPGLTFLKDAPEFHSRYITTVIQRIFYVVNRSWTGKITLTELRRNNFLQTLALLEEEEDINQVTDYFSYEHFYVIYCKFWELDTDHDLYIDEKDLARHNDHAISSRIIERIFSGAVTRGNAVQREKKMSYADFVWFLISEEDKKSPTSIEYWFRCLDLDGDGVLSMFELESFYDEQCRRMEQLGIEPLPFSDCLCQMLDLVKPKHEGKITLLDLKRCKMAYIFFDTFFNLEKYLEHEQKDPFAMQKEVEGDIVLEQSDWDRYAAEEYEVLVAEESANQQLQAMSYEEELEEALLGKPVSRLTLSEAPGPASQTCGQRLLAAGDGEGFDDFEY